MVHFFGGTVNPTSQFEIFNFQYSVKKMHELEGSDPVEMLHQCENLQSINNLPVWQKVALLERRFTYQMIIRKEDDALETLREITALALSEKGTFTSCIKDLSCSLLVLKEALEHPSTTNRIDSLQKALRNVEKYPGDHLTTVNLISGKYYLLKGCLKSVQKDFSKAHTYFEKSEMIFKRLKMPYQEASASLLQAQIAMKNRNLNSFFNLYNTNYSTQYSKFPILNLRVLVDCFSATNTYIDQLSKDKENLNSNGEKIKEFQNHTKACALMIQAEMSKFKDQKLLSTKEFNYINKTIKGALQ